MPTSTQTVCLCTDARNRSSSGPVWKHLHATSQRSSFRPQSRYHGLSQMRCCSLMAIHMDSGYRSYSECSYLLVRMPGPRNGKTVQLSGPYSNHSTMETRLLLLPCCSQLYVDACHCPWKRDRYSPPAWNRRRVWFPATLPTEIGGGLVRYNSAASSTCQQDIILILLFISTAPLDLNVGAIKISRLYSSHSLPWASRATFISSEIKPMTTARSYVNSCT